MNRYNPHLAFSKHFPQSLQSLAAALSQKLEEGHICIDLNEDPVYKNIPLQDQYTAVTDSGNYITAPFILHKEKVYLNRYFCYENTILNKIHDLILEGKAKSLQRVTALLIYKDNLKNIFQHNSENTNMQLIAAVSSYLNNFSVITGGPGTGKTTAVANLLALLYNENPNMKVAVAAPTGKASSRLDEVFMNYKNSAVEESINKKIISLKAVTIHRLLGGYKRFIHNAENPLDLDLLIVDECSMIDASLMAKLLMAVKNNCRVIFLGDRNQLSSVEAGSIFADICVAGLSEGNLFSSDFLNLLGQNDIITNELKTSHSDFLLKDTITELLKTHRFDLNKGISQFSRIVINGKSEELNYSEYTNIEAQDQSVIIIDSGNFDLNIDNHFLNLLEKIKAYFKEKDLSKSFELLNSFRILCTTREGKYGIYNMNRLIEQLISCRKSKNEFYHKQAVLITQNNHDLGIYNGDIGIIIDENEGKRDSEGHKLKESPAAYFKIKDELKRVPLMYLTDYETAFAMTIHKSQGSEYDNVYVFLPSDPEHPLLSRELLYTAVTRARKGCFVYGKEEVIRKTIEKRIKRVSGISSRLKIQNKPLNPNL
jgi:exodeoxyribonuclease V alpha subunit